MEETKRERFIRVAEARTNKVLKLMELLGNCSNKNNYEYEKKDVTKIINVLEKELEILKNKFNEIETKEKFKL